MTSKLSAKSILPQHTVTKSTFGLRNASKLSISLIIKWIYWRRERDSNPRSPSGLSGFQDRLFQPLTHPSAGVTSSAFSSLYGGTGSAPAPPVACWLQTAFSKPALRPLLSRPWTNRDCL